MQIEKNVPYESTKNFRGLGNHRSSYPFMEMEVGDSVFDEGSETLHGSKAYWAARKYAERSGDRKFSALRMEGGVRIWRVA